MVCATVDQYLGFEQTICIGQISPKDPYLEELGPDDVGHCAGVMQRRVLEAEHVLCCAAASKSVSGDGCYTVESCGAGQCQCTLRRFCGGRSCHMHEDLQGDEVKHWLLTLYVCSKNSSKSRMSRRKGVDPGLGPSD